MDFPGEKLVTRMWETVTEKGIGSLLRPWQMRREGRAGLDVRKEALLVLAQAERDAEEIRAGRKQLTEGRGLVALPPPREGVVEARAAEVLDVIAARVNARMLADGIRKEVNTSKALLAAEAELENDVQEPPERKVEADWLFRWREGASTVSAEELHNLWGRVLAGEVKSPGTFSLRTLDFLRNLSQAEAVSIARLCRFVVDNWIVRDDVLKREGVTLQFLLGMQDLGIVSGVESLGLTTTLNSTEETTFVRGFVSNNRVLIATHEDRTKTLKLGVYALTTIGREVLLLGKFEAHDDYLRSIGQQICAQGFDVALAGYVREDDKRLRVLPNAEEVCRRKEGSG